MITVLALYVFARSANARYSLARVESTPGLLSISDMNAQTRIVFACESATFAQPASESGTLLTFTPGVAADAVEARAAKASTVARKRRMVAL